MRPAEVRKFCVIDVACTSLTKTAMSQLQISAQQKLYVVHDKQKRHG